MTQASFRCCDRLKKQGRRANDTFDEMIATTFGVISEASFSGDKGFDRHVVHGEINLYVVKTGKISIADILGMPDQVPRW